MAADPGRAMDGEGAVALDGGRLRVARPYLELFRANGLETFEAVMALPAGRLRRDFPGRRTSRLELRAPDGRGQAVYLKRYYPEYLSGWDRLGRRLGWPGFGDEARGEWEAVCVVAALGIPTLQLVAMGQDAPGAGDAGVRRSFLMTAELAGAEEGHRLAVTLGAAERRALLRRVAAFTRRLHGAGWVHKDLYLCHYMVTPVGPEPAIHLIDLQRLARPGWLVERWVVKDLAALAYSSLKAGATRGDLAAAFRVYRGGRPMDAGMRRLARKVLRRIAWLRTRRPRHDTDFEQLPSDR